MSCKQTHSKNPEHLLKSSGEHYRNMNALFNLVVSIEVSWVCHLCRSALPTRLFLPHQHANPLKTNMDNGSWMMNDSKLMDIYGGFGWFRCWMSYISSLFRNPHTWPANQRDLWDAQQHSPWPSPIAVPALRPPRPPRRYSARSPRNQGLAECPERRGPEVLRILARRMGISMLIKFVDFNLVQKHFV
jgi:hypothetical protein